MKTHPILVTTIIGALLALNLWLARPVLAAPPYVHRIPHVPDWDQPVHVPAANQAPSGPWGAWCVPTATANIVGYYNDKGVAGIGDDMVFPVTVPWKDPNWQDDTADGNLVPQRTDLGWYLNTNDLGLDGNPNSPGYRGTKLQHIMDGAAGNGGLIGGGSGYFPSAGLLDVFVTNYGAYRMDPGIYPAFDTTGHAQHLHIDGAAYSLIMTEIDANRPLLAHFDHFNLSSRTRASDPNLGGDFDWATWGSPPEYDPNGYIDDETGEVWHPSEGLGHTATVVGYWADANNPAGALAIIVYDNADGTLPGPAPLPLILPWWGSHWTGLTFIDHGIQPPVVTSPNGGEAWVADSNYNITWANAGTIADVVIEYSTNNGSSFSGVSPPNTGNTGSYDWFTLVVDSNQCLVRISSAVDANIYDTSNDLFTIYQCTLYYDLTGDCFVNLLDLDALASEWLECGNPFDPNCVP